MASVSGPEHCCVRIGIGWTGGRRAAQIHGVPPTTTLRYFPVGAVKLRPFFFQFRRPLRTRMRTASTYRHAGNRGRHLPRNVSPTRFPVRELCSQYYHAEKLLSIDNATNRYYSARARSDCWVRFAASCCGRLHNCKDISRRDDDHRPAQFSVIADPGSAASKSWGFRGRPSVSSNEWVLRSHCPPSIAMNRLFSDSASVGWAKTPSRSAV